MSVKVTTNSLAFMVGFERAHDCLYLSYSDFKSMTLTPSTLNIVFTRFEIFLSGSRLSYLAQGLSEHRVELVSIDANALDSESVFVQSMRITEL